MQQSDEALLERKRDEAWNRLARKTKGEVLVKQNVYVASSHKYAGRVEPLKWQTRSVNGSEPTVTAQVLLEEVEFFSTVLSADSGWVRVNRADEAHRQEDQLNEMDGIATKMRKLVKKGSQGQHYEGDINWAMVENIMQIMYELDAAIPRDQQQSAGDREGEEEDEAR